jgi:hypothetical protein
VRFHRDRFPTRRIASYIDDEKIAKLGTSYTAAAEEMLVEGAPTDSADVPNQRTAAERAAVDRAASLRAVFASSPRPGLGPDAAPRVPGETTGSRPVADAGRPGAGAPSAGVPGGAGSFGGAPGGAGSFGGVPGAAWPAAGPGASYGHGPAVDPGGQSLQAAAAKRRKGRLWLILIVIALIAIGGGAAYLATRGNPFRADDRVAAVDPTRSETADPLATETGLAGEPELPLGPSIAASEPSIATSAPVESAPTPGASASISAPPPPGGRPNPAKTNLALHKKAKSLSDEQPQYPASAAVDGDAGTLWSSGISDPQWIRVDLGDVWSVTDIKLNWENASAKSYHVDVSLDAKHWTTVYRTTSGTAGVRDIPIHPTPARYVRMYGTARNGQFGYSLLEFEVR